MEKQKDPRTFALDTSLNGRKAATAVRDAIYKERPADYRFLAMYSARLRFCNDRSNLWIANDLHRSDGECFDGSGRFWHCNLKLCPYCVSRSARRSRRILRSALDKNPSPPNPTPKFVTMTIENPGLGILQTRALVNDSWQRFRKRKYFREAIRGGSKNEEFTVTKNGYHYHLHGLFQSNYIHYQTFRYQWTDCVRNSFAAIGLQLEPKTTDQMLMVKVKSLTDRESAVHEVTKYITKSDSWSKVSSAELLNICRVPRWPRMFDLFGSFKIAERSCVASDDEASSSILDTKRISDGEPELNWRETATTARHEDVAGLLQDQYVRAIEFNRLRLRHKFPYATFHQISYSLNPNLETDTTNLLKKLDRLHKQPDSPRSLKDLDELNAPL